MLSIKSSHSLIMISTFCLFIQSSYSTAASKTRVYVPKLITRPIKITKGIDQEIHLRESEVQKRAQSETSYLMQLLLEKEKQMKSLVTLMQVQRNYENDLFAFAFENESILCIKKNVDGTWGPLLEINPEFCGHAGNEPDPITQLQWIDDNRLTYIGQNSQTRKTLYMTDACKPRNGMTILFKSKL